MDLSNIKVNTGSAYELINPYAVGGIYFSVSDTSPADIFGGTWTAMAEKFIRISQSAAETTAGSDTVSHKHIMPVSLEYYANVGHYVQYRIDGNGNGYYGHQYTEGTKLQRITLENLNQAVASTWTQLENITGRYMYTSSTSTDNKPAYMTVFAWKRTA